MILRGVDGGGGAGRSFAAENGGGEKGDEEADGQRLYERVGDVDERVLVELPGAAGRRGPRSELQARGSIGFAADPSLMEVMPRVWSMEMQVLRLR